MLLPAYEQGLRGRHTLRYLREYQHNQWLSRDELDALQWRKLQALLTHCWEEVPYYRERWSAAGVGGVGDIRSRADFARLPSLSRADVRGHSGRLAARSFRDRLLYKTTGGSTGEPLRIGYTRESYERRMAVMFRGYGWAGAHPGTRTMYLWGVDHGTTGWRERLHHAAYNRRFLSCYGMNEQNIGQYADAIDRHRPEVLVGYVAPLVRLARWLHQQQGRRWSPRAVLAAAEALQHGQRTLIEGAFRSPVYNTYGCREFMLVASQCEHRGGLHVNADHLVLEQGPAVSGHHGREALVTDLHNLGMPLVRYQIGDLVTLDERPCPCGRPLPLVATVHGRSMDVLRSPDGSVVGEFLEKLVFETAGIQRFQAVQHRLDEIEVRIVRGAGFDEASLDAIRARMHEAYGESLALRFEFREELPLTPTGKLRVAISTVASTVYGWLDGLGSTLVRLELERFMPMVGAA